MSESTQKKRAMKKNKMNYTRISNGLAETESYLKELTQGEEYGTYHNELFKALQDAIECLSSLD